MQEANYNWDCEVSAIDGKQAKEYEVGDLFGVICNSTNSQAELVAPITEQALDKKQKYFYKILETRSVSPDRIDLVVTSYQVKGHKNIPFSFIDAKQTKGLSQPLELKIKSVIKQDQLQKGQTLKPFGPTGPYKIEMPWWFFTSFIVAGLLLILIVGLYIRKYFKRKKFLEKLEQLQSPLGAYGQVNKDIRKLAKSISLIGEDHFDSDEGRKFLRKLNSYVELYLVRELKVQATDQSFNTTLGELKNRHKIIHKRCGVQLAKFNKELTRVLNSNRVLLFDCEQLSAMAKNLVIAIHHQYQRSSK